MSGNFFSKFDSEYFLLIIFLKYLLILLLMLIFVTKMTLLEKNKICRTFRAVGHLGTLQTDTLSGEATLPVSVELPFSIGVSFQSKKSVEKELFWKDFVQGSNRKSQNVFHQKW